MKNLWVLLIVVLIACNGNKPINRIVPENWSEISKNAMGTSVNMMMWQGDPLINKYMTEWVVPEVKKRFNIDLKILPGQGNEIVKMLMTGIEQETKSGNVDICWINGETFYQLQQIDALYGPFVNILPNSKLIDFENPFIKYDFQQETKGFECPWGNVQECIIYDSIRTPHPPSNLIQLSKYVKSYPGRFTIPAEFAGMTLLKSWMVELAGKGPEYFDGQFDSLKYQQVSIKLWDFINSNKQYFWRRGETFPEKLSAMHQMFANNELDFTFSNNDAEVDNKIFQGVFPNTAKAYVPEVGSIQNSHYLGIPKNAGNKNAALMVINFLISPEAQYQKLQPKVWGDGTILDENKLDDFWKQKFVTSSGRINAPERRLINQKAIKEPAPEYMIRLYADFRNEVINQK